MRRILISGRAAEIDPEEVIEFTLRSNFLEFTELQGSFTTTFSLPYKHSPTNQLIFQFAGNPKRSARGVLSLPFEFWWKGTRKYIGSVEVKQVQDKVECTATVANGALNETAKELFCDELELGGLSMIHQAYFSPDDIFCLPRIWNEREGRAPIANNWTGSTYTVDDSYDSNGILVPVVPCLYTRHALKIVLEKFGFIFYDQYFEGSELDDTAILSLKDINILLSGTYTTPTLFQTKGMYPHIKVVDLIKGICAFFNLILDFRGDEVYLYSRNSVLTADLIETKTTTPQINLSRTKYAYGYEIDAADAYYAAEGWGDIKDLKREIVSWGAELTEGLVDSTISLDDKIYRESKYGHYFEKKLHTDNHSVAWHRISIHSAQTIGDDFDEVIRTQLQPVGYFTSGTVDSSNEFVEIPYAGSLYEPQKFENFRIGFVHDGVTQQYLKNQSDGGTNLYNPDWSTETVYNLEWKSFLEWLNDDAETIEATIEEESADYFFNRLDFTKRYVNQDGVKFILTEVVIGFNDKRMSKPKIKAVTMR